MAEEKASFSESFGGEIVEAMLGDMVSGALKNSVKSTFGSIFSKIGEPWKRRAGSMLFGNTDTAEAMYWISVERAESLKDCSPEIIDHYLIELGKLSPEKQNIYVDNTIQCWILEYKKESGGKDVPANEVVELVIQTTAKVIASHAKRVARNPEAWVALTKIQDIDKPLMPRDFQAANDQLRQKIAAVKKKQAMFRKNLNPLNWRRK